jgi:hypothetical protein
MNQLVLCDDRGLNREALTIGYSYRVSLMCQFAHGTRSRNSPAQMKATPSYVRTGTGTRQEVPTLANRVSPHSGGLWKVIAAKGKSNSGTPKMMNHR